MNELHLTSPLTTERIREVKVNDVLYLSGPLFTARDMAHLRIRDLLGRNQPLPVDFQGAAVFHAGPGVKKTADGYKVVLIGPTTSTRMGAYSEMMGKLGVKILAGKAGVADDSLGPFQKYGMVYLQTAPGCGSLHAQAVKAVKNVYWQDLGMPEAIWALEVSNWGPLIVAMDSHGNSIYRDIREAGRKKVDALLQKMA